MRHPPMDVGIGVGSGPPLARTLAMVRVARALGVTSVWVVDHLTGFFPKVMWDSQFTWLSRRGGSPDAFFEWQTLAGHLASRAGRLQLGVGVTEAIRRHPVVLAQAALTLSHLTRRPPILGIGSGEAENVTPYGLSFDRPVSRLEEALEVLRMCFTATGSMSFEGDFFTLDEATLDLVPGVGGMPRIWLGAHGPRMLRLTGRHADGWLPAIPMSPEEYARSLGVVHASAVEHGRDPSSIVPAMTVPYVVGRNAADVDIQLRHPAVRFLALLAPDQTWQQAGFRHPLGEGFGGITEFVPDRYDRSDLQDAIEAVPDELLRARLVAGTPDEVVGRLRELGEAGLQHVVLSPVSPIVSRRALVFAARTLPSIVRRLRNG